MIAYLLVCRLNEMAKNDLTDYYATRSFEYEHIYQKSERQADLKRLQGRIAGSFKGHHLLEVACGTGYWTQFAARSARSIVATDYNEVVLDIARKKDYGDCSIKFIRSDAYTLNNVNGPFSAALVAFWWSHVPKSKLNSFLKVLHSNLANGATIVFLDNLYVEGSSTPISRYDDEGNTYQNRKLSDGSEHEVLKNFPARCDFVKQIEKSENLEFTELDYFWIAQYTMKGNTLN